MRPPSTLMIAIIDYGMSNLRSVRHAFTALGADARIVDTPSTLKNARALILPGDGAFGPAMQSLTARGWLEPLHAALARGAPFLGICLGMQLLFESSEENGAHRGLGILRGTVKKFPRAVGKLPQIGWNQLQIQPQSKFLAGIAENAFAYFVHSYYCAPMDENIIAARTNYGISYASAIEAGKVWGAQFHPEKSGADGLKMLQNFLEML